MNSGECVPLVSIVMGSESDLSIMKESKSVLASFEIPNEMRVISAHRNPEGIREYAMNAESRGIKIIIAAAGKAAHLAGVTASMTPLPVIGVPMTTSDLGGLDSLLSMVQMPGGVPVATVAIGSSGAKNAALLAVQILALNNESLMGKFKNYKRKMAEDVKAADERVRNS